MKPRYNQDPPPGLAEYAMAKKEMEGYHAEVIEIKISFSLPTWYPPARLETSHTDRSYHDPGRRWYKNPALDNLYNLKGCIENGDSYVIFEIPPGSDLKKQIKKIQGKLERLINRYKEARQEGDKKNGQ